MRKLVYANRLSGFCIGRSARSEMERSEIELLRNGSVENVSGAEGRSARSEMERSEIGLPRNGSVENVSGAEGRSARSEMERSEIELPRNGNAAGLSRKPEAVLVFRQIN